MSARKPKSADVNILKLNEKMKQFTKEHDIPETQEFEPVFPVPSPDISKDAEENKQHIVPYLQQEANISNTTERAEDEKERELQSITQEKDNNLTIQPDQKIPSFIKRIDREKPAPYHERVKSLHVKIEAELFNELDSICKAFNITKTEIIQELLIEYLPLIREYWSQKTSLQ
ncbi:MAG: hypothetical protein ACOX4N_00445 [Dethiobacteraceae bacterium]